MAAMSLAMVWLVQQVYTASGHGSNGAEVVGVVTSSSVSPMSKRSTSAISSAMLCACGTLMQLWTVMSVCTQ